MMVPIQLNGDIPEDGHRGGDEYDDDGDYAGSKYVRDER